MKKEQEINKSITVKGENKNIKEKRKDYSDINLKNDAELTREELTEIVVKVC